MISTTLTFIKINIQKKERLSSNELNLIMLETLHKYFGYTEFRPLQEEINTAF